MRHGSILYSSPSRELIDDLILIRLDPVDAVAQWASTSATLIAHKLKFCLPDLRLLFRHVYCQLDELHDPSYLLATRRPQMSVP
jgi:hypothetical protein